MGTHYQSPVNYTVSQIDIASESVLFIYQSLKDCEDALSPFQKGSEKEGTSPNGQIDWVTPVAQECISKLCSASASCPGLFFIACILIQYICKPGVTALYFSTKSKEVDASYSVNIHLMLYLPLIGSSCCYPVSCVLAIYYYDY